MTARRAPPKRRSRWSWRNPVTRGWIYQLAVLLLLAAAVAWLANNTLANMAARGIHSGWDFLTQTAGFDIGERLIPYESVDPYWKAFLVGVLNTLRVALLGIVLITLLGGAIGVGRFARNALVRGLCYAYVELFRNVPVLVQLLVWYLVLVEFLPEAMEPLSVGGLFFLSKGGFGFPLPEATPGLAWLAVGVLMGLAVAGSMRWREQRRFARDGGVPPSLLLKPAAIVVVGGMLGGVYGLWSSQPLQWSVPVPGGFSLEGGATLSTEFLAVLLGLVFYTSAFVAEVVRAGIASVPRGQTEAAQSIGLSGAQTIRLVVLPQALRVIIPPMTNQYLNLTKNSSLAVAVGYPEVVSIANTTLNQTGRAVECIVIIMGVYLCTSLITAVAMGAYNRRVALKDR